MHLRRCKHVIWINYARALDQLYSKDKSHVYEFLSTLPPKSVNIFLKPYTYIVKLSYTVGLGGTGADPQI